MNWIPVVCAWACVAITLVAAITDARTGRIPNWLTFPPMIIGPFVWLLYGGPKDLLVRMPMGSSMLGSVLSLLVCGAVPYFALYRKKAIGAGDVKLFAALGALGLLHLGIEAMFYSFCAGALLALVQLAWRGMLLHTLTNAFFIVINPVLPKSKRRTISHELMTKMRFGPAIFLGTLVAVLGSFPRPF